MPEEKNVNQERIPDPQPRREGEEKLPPENPVLRRGGRNHLFEVEKDEKPQKKDDLDNQVDPGPPGPP